MARAGILHDAGFGPRPLALRRGFLQLEWVAGSPIRGRATNRELLERLAAYLAFLKRHFGTGVNDNAADLQEMIATNVGEDAAAAGSDAATITGLDDHQAVEPSERTAIDGRMMPHEWIASATGLTKTDALDHHADDFFPGCRDIAWDVAGAIVEFDLDRQQAAFLVDGYRRASRDSGICRRLAFYRVAYTAWRIGYATLAAESVGESADGARFRADLTRYRRSLAGPA
jgi:hypothetical protein